MAGDRTQAERLARLEERVASLIRRQEASEERIGDTLAQLSEVASDSRQERARLEALEGALSEAIRDQGREIQQSQEVLLRIGSALDSLNTSIGYLGKQGETPAIPEPPGQKLLAKLMDDRRFWAIAFILSLGAASAFGASLSEVGSAVRALLGG